MARIAGVNLPAQKHVWVGLQSIYGIGRTRSVEILGSTGIDESIRVKDLTDDQLVALRDEIEKNYKVEGELRRETQASIKRLKEIGSYRGSRHIKGLPARGQRTKTNSRTVRGNVRRTMGSGRTKQEKK